MKTLRTFLLITLLLANACYYDNFSELHPLDGFVNTCGDTTPATYSGAVNLIMKTNCTSCHSSSVHSGNVILDTYEGVKTEALNGKLMGSILHNSGYKAMPPGTSIRDCEIQKLENWISAQTPQ